MIDKNLSRKDIMFVNGQSDGRWSITHSWDMRNGSRKSLITDEVGDKEDQLFETVEDFIQYYFDTYKYNVGSRNRWVIIVVDYKPDFLGKIFKIGDTDCVTIKDKKIDQIISMPVKIYKKYYVEDGING